MKPWRPPPRLVEVPRTVQLVAGRLRLVVARTLKATLLVFVKVSWNAPLTSTRAELMTGGAGAVGAATVMVKVCTAVVRARPPAVASSVRDTPMVATPLVPLGV